MTIVIQWGMGYANPPDNVFDGNWYYGLVVILFGNFHTQSRSINLILQSIKYPSSL